MVDKVYENKLRRMALRRGYVLEKSRRRDKRATDFGMYRLLVDHRDIDSEEAQAQPFTLRIEEVEHFLNQLGDDD